MNWFGVRDLRLKKAWGLRGPVGEGRPESLGVAKERASTEEELFWEKGRWERSGYR